MRPVHTLMRGAHLHIDDIVVADGERGTGGGRALMDYAEADARARGLTAVFLDARSQAIGFLRNARLWAAPKPVDEEDSIADGRKRATYPARTEEPDSPSERWFTTYCTITGGRPMQMMDSALNLAHDAPVVLLTDDARQGVTGHNVRYVLGWGLASVVLAFVLVESWRRMACLVLLRPEIGGCGRSTHSVTFRPDPALPGTAHSLELRKSPAAASLGRASMICVQAQVEGTGRRDPECTLSILISTGGRDRCPKTVLQAHDLSARACQRKGGYTYLRQDKADYVLSSWTEWFDLDKQLEHMDGLGHQVDVVCSIGPFSVFFSDLPAEEGRDAAIHWNEEMAGAQRKYPGRVWASAAHCES